jgi:large subunit ribosomal protein L25
MADNIVLKATVRDTVGTPSAVKGRKQGLMPAIMYGHGKAPCSFTVNLHGFTTALNHGHRIMDLEIDGKTETAMLKALQYDYLGKDVIHADFVRVDMSETVHVSVSVVFKGTAIGASKGGMLDTQLDQVEIECAVSVIPETLEVSVKELEVGSAIHASDIVLPAGAKLVTAPEAVIVTCHVVAEAKTTEEMQEELPEGGPEVITEKAPEEE